MILEVCGPFREDVHALIFLWWITQIVEDPLANELPFQGHGKPAKVASNRCAVVVIEVPERRNVDPVISQKRSHVFAIQLRGSLSFVGDWLPIHPHPKTFFSLMIRRPPRSTLFP